MPPPPEERSLLLTIRPLLAGINFSRPFSQTIYSCHALTVPQNAFCGVNPAVTVSGLYVAVSAAQSVAISRRVSLIRVRAPDTYVSTRATILVTVVYSFSNTLRPVSTIVAPIFEKVFLIVSHAPDQSPFNICIPTVKIPVRASNNILKVHFITSNATVNIAEITSHSVPT